MVKKWRTRLGDPDTDAVPSQLQLITLVLGTVLLVELGPATLSRLLPLVLGDSL